MLAPIVVLALLSTAKLIGYARTAGRVPAAASIVALLCVAATQVVFWTFTFPVNRATQDWTKVLPHWDQLRRRWEYSHASSAVLNRVAFGSAVLATLWS